MNLGPSSGCVCSFMAVFMVVIAGCSDSGPDRGATDRGSAGREARYRGKTASEWVGELQACSLKDEAFMGLTSGDREALPVLAEMLKNEAWPVRSCAASSLAKMGADAGDALPGLIEAAAGDEYLTVRFSAIRAIGNIGPAAGGAVPVLIENLKVREKRAPNPKGPARYFGDVRCAAAETLGKIGPGAREAIPELEKLTDDDDVMVRGAAAAALGKFGERNKTGDTGDSKAYKGYKRYRGQQGKQVMSGRKKQGIRGVLFNKK